MHGLSDAEFANRRKRLQQLVGEEGLDALLVHSDEADCANVRYLSDYWPAFEHAGVVVPAEGEPLLIIGPESLTFARDRSRIPTIKQILEYRESAEPDYPGMKLDTFADAFAAASGGKRVRRIGVAGFAVMPVTVYEALKRAMPEAELIRADHLMNRMRFIKSPEEIELQRESYRIAELALGAALEEMRPGMTELQVVGVAQHALYMNGAEYESMPQYVLSGVSSTHAVGRPSHKPLQAGEMIQLNIGGRVAGYAASVGRPVCLGKMSGEMRRLAEFALRAHAKTYALMRAGVSARQVVADYMAFVEKEGFSRYLLYGPCHGLGIMEVEEPWMELNSEYDLEANMTFQVDTFFATPEFGLRYEDGVRVTESGVEPYSDQRLSVIELPA